MESRGSLGWKGVREKKIMKRKIRCSKVHRSAPPVYDHAYHVVDEVDVLLDLPCSECTF